ncbi:MAG: hypothetical protein HYY86_01780 [Candidatus Harrisonbacteria bacterium]|nr:hypothetical protein [Candidatus Harrisonbacteria bacterium]
MKVHRLTFKGWRGYVKHVYLETEKSVLFAAGVEMFWQYNCILSNKEYLAKQIKEALAYEIKNVKEPILARMIDGWATTDNRWHADELKKMMEEGIMSLCKSSK